LADQLFPTDAFSGRQDAALHGRRDALPLPFRAFADRGSVKMRPKMAAIFLVRVKGNCWDTKSFAWMAVRNAR
jgi:hypothetical protein